MGIEKNTLLIFTSHNGSYMYRINDDNSDHLDIVKIQGFHASNHQSSYIWRGTKADIYDGGPRVPMIVK